MREPLANQLRSRTIYQCIDRLTVLPDFIYMYVYFITEVILNRGCLYSDI